MLKQKYYGDDLLHLCATYEPQKGKGFPYSLPSIGPGADPGVQAVSPQMTIGYPSGGRLPLLSAMPAVTFPTEEHHHPWPVSSYTAWYNLSKVVTQLLPRVEFEPTTC